jgi:5-methylcytosine-specific restriction endonuclease McrA
MQKHVSNYFKAHDLNPYEALMCKVCKVCKAADIHHIMPRSKFGTKTKHLQDLPSNLIPLCRECHDKAHAEKYSKEFLYDKTRT